MRKLLPQQMRKVMRLTGILLIVVCVQVSAHSCKQTVSYSVKDVPVTDVFRSMEKQTGISFSFKYEVLKVLERQSSGFYLIGRTSFEAGIVIDQQGEALVGATIAIENGKCATLTDEKGFFAIMGVAGNDLSLLDLPKLANNIPGETQIIAYGNTTQRLNVGDVTTVKGKEIYKQPMGEPLLALEGRVPGLLASKASGVSGSDVISIAGDNDLIRIIIDRVPYHSQILATLLGSILGVSSGSVDADAIAIYESRAANGAILITTKRGKIGQPRFDLSVEGEASSNDGIAPVSYLGKMVGFTLGGHPLQA